jgi:hypothetical protein
MCSQRTPNESGDGATRKTRRASSGGAKMRMHGRALWIVAGAVATALGAGPALRAQSLADSARLEKARRAREANVDPRHGAVFGPQDVLRYGQKGTLTAAVNEAAATEPATEQDTSKDYWEMELAVARAVYERAQRTAQDADAALRDAREQPFPDTYTEALEAVAAQQALADQDAEARTDAAAARTQLAEVEAEAGSASAQ